MTDGVQLPPGTWGNEPDAFLRALRSPWYRLIVSLEDVFTRATASFAHELGHRIVHMPLTTRTITCPTGLGSDSQPVPVTVNGVKTYLADSMQFLLEYGIRLAPQGCYSIEQTFRGDLPDETHLNQFLHSEWELPGDLDTLIRHVEAYVRHLATAFLDEQGDALRAAVGDVSHLDRMAGYDGGFPRLTFEEAVRLLDDDDRAVRHEGDRRTLTRHGERRITEMVNEFVWVTHFDHLSVPFYQAFADDTQLYARNADLFFGIGEVVGSGQRHATGADVRKALATHQVSEQDYAWYVRLKDEFPMTTSGFGLGVERFLLWALRHNDIRDIPLVSRIGERPDWPASVDRP
jgi:asparaginyl-tRNA synthetase